MKSGLKVFDEIPKWNVVAWTSFIAGYVNNDCASEAIRVFKDMESLNVEPNEITLVHVLVACARSRDLGTRKLVHCHVHQLGYDPFVSSCNPNLVLATAIFDMYVKCSNINTARDLFDKMPMRKLNKATFLSAISACGKAGDLALGQSFHTYVMNICKDVAVGTALVDMYAKSGDAESARKVFSDLKRKDTMVWTSMIIGLAMHGHEEEALSTFKRNVYADQVRSHIREVETVGSGVYVLLSNIYARAGKWQEAKMARELMKHKSIVKTLGHSKVEIKLSTL
ncbi:hypothetical protein Q3G72_013519 [Acer saccharum]|nr:hypothetical protein Q3G72_013519 [Acer saccharum]